MAAKKRKNLVPKSKYGIKCPYSMKATSITVHNTDNDASAKNEVAYMIRNDLQVSFHWAVDEIEAVQGVPSSRNAWHAGDGGKGEGNRTSIGIEICRSTGDLATFKKCEENAARLIAEMLHHRNWDTSRVKRHKDWSGKDCPHRTMELGWNRFLAMIQVELDTLEGKKGYERKTPVPRLLPKEPVGSGYGDKTDILRLQKFLNWYGLETPITKKFDEKTKSNLGKFQVKEGLKKDYSFGPATKAKARMIRKAEK